MPKVYSSIANVTGAVSHAIHYKGFKLLDGEAQREVVTFSNAQKQKEFKDHVDEITEEFAIVDEISGGAPYIVEEMEDEAATPMLAMSNFDRWWSFRTSMAKWVQDVVEKGATLPPYELRVFLH